jgi:hypothetical protein
MKLTILAMAAALGGSSIALAQSDPNGANVPPGDGITRMGTDPNGQAYTPPGYNIGLNVYPPATAASGANPGMENYPACSAEVKDRCVQTYTKWTSRRR